MRLGIGNRESGTGNREPNYLRFRQKSIAPRFCRSQVEWGRSDAPAGRAGVRTPKPLIDPIVIDGEHLSLGQLTPNEHRHRGGHLPPRSPRHHERSFNSIAARAGDGSHPQLGLLPYREDAKTRRTNRSAARLGVWALSSSPCCCCCTFCVPLRRPFLRPLSPAVVATCRGRGAGVADRPTGNRPMARACATRARADHADWIRARGEWRWGRSR